MQKNTINSNKSSNLLYSSVLALILLMAGVGSANAATYTASGNGNWNVASTWGGAGVPTAADDVNIGNYTITLSANAACTNFITGSGWGIVLGSNNLTMSGNLTFNCNSGTITTTTGYIILNGTTQIISLLCGATIPNLRLTNSTNVSMGTQNNLTITGNFDCQTGSSTFTNNNAPGWSSGSLIVKGTCTAPNCTFIAGTNIYVTSMDFTQCTSNPIQVGSFTDNQSTALIIFGSKNVTTTTIFTGTYKTNIQGTGTVTVLNPPKQFISKNSGDWTLKSTWLQSTDGGVTWVAATTTPTSTDALVTIRSGHTVALTGATTVSDLAINGSLDLNTYALTGTGGMTVSPIGTLLVGGASNFPTGFTSTTLNTGSTVNYDMVGAQTVLGLTYSNLILSGSGVKTLQTGTTSITGNLNLSGTATTTTVANLTIGGNLNIGDGTAFTVGPFNFTVAGSTTVGAGASGSINFYNTGTKIFTGLVTVAKGASWIINDSPIEYRGGITIDPTYGYQFVSGNGVQSFTTNNQTLTCKNDGYNGFTLFSLRYMTVTGVVVTNNGALVVNNSISGTGTLTQASNAYLYLDINPAIANLDATSNFNTVSYRTTQTVFSTNYYNLNFTSSGIKTITSSFSVIGNLSIASGTSATLNSGVNVLANSLSLNSTAQANGTYGSTTSAATTKNNTYFASLGIVTVNAACAYGSNTSSAITVTPVVNMTSNPQTVSSTFASHQYFVLNVIKGLTYQVYTSSAPGSALKMGVYDEGNTLGLLASSFSNTGNPGWSNSNDVYLSFTSPLSGQVRVLINSQSDCAATNITGLTVNANVSGGNNTQDSQTAAGTDKWTGQVYDSKSGTFLFENYLGYYDVGTESFSESFGTGPSWPGDDATSFNVYSNGVVRATEKDISFNVRYLMNSTRRGFYSANIVSDDGAKLIVDGNVVYNHWDPHSPTTNNSVLLSLTGSSLLTLEYFEQAGQNGISFNMAVILLNQLSNIPQTLCKGAPGTPISGDVFPPLLSGMYNSGYQWYYSTPTDPTRRIITGATGATFTPNASAAPFNNLSGIYYIYRVAKLSTTNNYNPNPYDATNESNAVTVRIKDCTNYWIGGPSSTDWNTVINWTDGIPFPGDDIEFASSFNTGNAGADPFNDLVLNNYYTVGNFTNKSGKQLKIAPATSLTVNGSITTDNNNQIYIQSNGLQPNGSLIFPNATNVKATVEMYSKVSVVSGNYNWQYFGIPIAAATPTTYSPTFDGAFVRRNDETIQDYNGKWLSIPNSYVLSPFVGYEITKETPTTVLFQGQLVNANKTIPLTYTYTSAAYDPGQNLLANPYTAAIDITKIVFGTYTEHTVYLYNTGSYADWLTNNGETTNTNSTITAGQYLAIPQSIAGTGIIPKDIPSMSGFLVKVMGTNVSTSDNLTINYSSVINNVNPQRAPQSKGSSDKQYMQISLKGEHSGDIMWLINEPGTTHGFDNGWDGTKLSGAAGRPQLFAMEPSGNYQVSTSDDLNNTYLGFQAGLDVEDTLTFKNENLELKYDGVYLVDLVENKVVDITKSGTQYAFKAESTAAPIKRFKITTEPYIEGASDLTTQLKVFNDNSAVFVANQSNEKGELYFYDIMGRYLKKEIFGSNSISSFPLFSKSGAYVVKAVTNSEKVSKRIIVNYQGE